MSAASRALAAASLCALGACAVRLNAASPITAIDGRGRRISLADRPRRIVSLAPAVTEMLFALGLKGRIVGVTSQCSYPPEARLLPRIGDFRASVEKVIALKPDLIVASISANRQAIERLERLGRPVFAVDALRVEEVYDALRRVAAITGAQTEAHRVIQAMRLRVEAVHRRAGRIHHRPRVLVVVEERQLWVAGRDNFIDDVITLAGGVNVAREAGPGWHRLSPERVAAGRPEVILCTPGQERALMARSGWATVPAIRQRKVVPFPSDALVRPGPRLAEALEAVARILHPELFTDRR